MECLFDQVITTASPNQHGQSPAPLVKIRCSNRDVVTLSPAPLNDSPPLDSMDCSARATLRDELASETSFSFRQLRRELCPEIELFRNIRSLTMDEWDAFSTSTGEFEMSRSGDEALDKNNPRPKKKRKIHSPRSYHYTIGDYASSTYYLKFLSNNTVRVPFHRDCTVREQTHRLSKNPKSIFRAWFRMPLYKVELLSQRFLDEKWMKLSHHCRTEGQLKIKVDLLVMGALAVLGGTVHSFRQLPTVTNICATEHNNFFHLFISKLYSIRSEYIYLPRDAEELQSVMARYEEVGLPGAVGSIDVVHVKWSRCPAGDYNRSKGKESFPSLGFECISDFDRRICNVFGPQFGARNDKHIVKMDDGVAAVRDDWYNAVMWKYFDDKGYVKEERGAYLICDNGYLQWPITICPYMRSQTNSTMESCFSANVESVRKDVECVFGILKERWSSLQHGFHFRDIKTCQRIFVSCCVLHNMMLDEMTQDDANSKISRGISLPNDGVWLQGHTEQPVISASSSKKAKELAIQFHERRNKLSTHLKLCRQSSVN